jgi:hypothetical protein
MIDCSIASRALRFWVVSEWSSASGISCPRRPVRRRRAQRPQAALDVYFDERSAIARWAEALGDLARGPNDRKAMRIAASWIKVKDVAPSLS